MPPTCPQDAPKMTSWPPKMDPRTSQDGPKMPPKRLQMPSGWSKLCPAAQKTPQTSIWDPPGLVFRPSPDLNFDPFLAACGLDLGGLLGATLDV